MADSKKKITLSVRVHLVREYEWQGGMSEFEIKLPESALKDLTKLLDYGALVRQILPEAVEKYVEWAKERAIKENEAAAQARLEAKLAQEEVTSQDS